VSYGKAKAIAVIDQARAQGELLAISVITEMELVIGCRNKQELKAMKEFIAEFETMHFSEAVSLKAGELIERHHLSHHLGIPDAIIAATALVNEAELLIEEYPAF